MPTPDITDDRKKLTVGANKDRSKQAVEQVEIHSRDDPFNDTVLYMLEIYTTLHSKQLAIYVLYL